MEVFEIKKYLKEHKISYAELSEKSGVPIQTISKIFAGITPNPRIDTMQAIEKALGINQGQEELKNIPVALYEGVQGLSPEGMQDVIKYIEFVKAKEKGGK